MRQSCVPTGSRRSTYSAPILASSRLRAVRFRVERKSLPFRLQQRREVPAEGGAVGDVLDHLQRQHGVEAGHLAGRQQRLGRALPVVDAQAGPRGVRAGGADRLRGGIEAGDIGAGAGQELARQAGAAADVEHAEPR